MKPLPPLNMVEDVADRYNAALGGVHLPAYQPPVCLEAVVLEKPALQA